MVKEESVGHGEGRDVLRRDAFSCSGGAEDLLHAAGDRVITSLGNECSTTPDGVVLTKPDCGGSSFWERSEERARLRPGRGDRLLAISSLTVI